MKTILQWASWVISAITICFMFLGSLGYLLGNVRIFGVKWGTFYLFSGYLLLLAILLVLLDISSKCKNKD